MVKRRRVSPTIALIPLILAATLLIVLGSLVLGGCGGGEPAGGTSESVDDQSVIDEALVAKMDPDEFRAMITKATDHLTQNLGGDEAAASATFLAVDRGYDAYQLLTGSLSGGVQADGRILAADGSALLPARTTERIFGASGDGPGDGPGDGAGSEEARSPARPVLLASTSCELLLADAADSVVARANLASPGVFQINDVLGVMKEAFDDERAKVEADYEFEQRYAAIVLILAARGYDANQIAEAVVLGQIRSFWDTVEESEVCWYIEHTSGVVLRPKYPPLDPFAEMTCPAADKSAPTAFDPDAVKAALEEKGLGENAADGTTSDAGDGSATSGGGGGVPPGDDQGTPSGDGQSASQIDLSGRWLGHIMITRAAVNGVEISGLPSEGCSYTVIYELSTPITAELEMMPDGSGILAWSSQSVEVPGTSGGMWTLGNDGGSVAWTWQDGTVEFLVEPEGGGSLVIIGQPQVLADGTVALDGTWSADDTRDIFNTDELSDLEADGVFSVEMFVE